MLIDLAQQATISWKNPVYWTDSMLQCSQKQKGEHHHGTYRWDYFQRVSPSLQYRGRLQSRVVFPMGFFFSMGKDDWDQPVIGQYGLSDNGSISCSKVNTSPKCFPIACAIASRATPHNSARTLRQDFCPNSKFGKRRNTVCISRFSNWRSGAKRRLRLADAIARCCLYYITIFLPKWKAPFAFFLRFLSI